LGSVVGKLWLAIAAAHRASRYRRRKDPAGIRFLLEHLRPGDAAIDIGTYKGVYAHWMLRAVGPTGRVIAFEPQPIMAERARLTLGRFPNFELIEMGLSDEPGERELIVPGQKPSSTATFERDVVSSELERDRRKQGERRYTVLVETLDHCLEPLEVEKLRLIKCDVEGHELRVFRGAKRTIAKYRPAVMFESMPRHHTKDTVEDVLRFFADLDYSGSFFHQGERRPLKDRAAIVPKDYAFVPREWR
jgi:FkbM family methyltransferase